VLKGDGMHFTERKRPTRGMSSEKACAIKLKKWEVGRKEGKEILGLRSAGWSLG